MRQGDDALACHLFNIALEKVIRDSGVQTRGTISLKTVQIVAYADDIDLMARTTLGFNEVSLNLEKSARNMGLVINQEKTVYMCSGNDHILHVSRIRVKTLLYKTLISPVLTYGAETWVLSNQDEHRLSIFERQILRRIYGPVIEGGRWRIRTNQELLSIVWWEWHCEFMQIEQI